MKTNFSAKMHLFIIISSLITAIGIAMGIIFSFATDMGYFNFGGDLESYKSIMATYSNIDFSGKQDDAETIMIGICDKAFDEVGISDYSVVTGKSSNGGKIIYKFVLGTDDEKLSSAVEKINSGIKSNTSLEAGNETYCVSNAAFSIVRTKISGNKLLYTTLIIGAVIFVFHALYTLVRYKASMAFAAILADVHNVALYLSVLSITRAPFSSTAVIFAVLVLLTTIVGTCFYFDSAKKLIKSSDGKVEAFSIADDAAGSCLVMNLSFPAVFAFVAVILFVLLSISSLSVLAVLAPLSCALIFAISCAYGTAIFVPSVYSRFKLIGDNFKSKDKRSSVGKK